MPRSLDFEYLLTPNGLERHRSVQIDDEGRIKDICAASGEHFDGRLALPGMPNAHSHAFQRAMVGHGEARQGEDSFWSWRKFMYGLAGVLNPDDLYAIARRAYADMLGAGFTSVAEFHYLHHLPDGSASAEMGRAVTEAARDVGIRLLLLPVYYRCGGFGEAARPEQRRFVHESPDDYCRLLSQFADVPCGIAPHSLRAVAAAELPNLLAQAESVLGAGFPIHIHISEQQSEVDDCLKRHGLRPVALLARSVELNDRWNLVHATHAEEDERAAIIRTGARVILCPLTEAYLGDGIFAASEFVGAGGLLAIGSDSNVRIDAIEEIRLMEYGQRLQQHRRACLANEEGLGASLWSSLARTGAGALGMEVGAIAPGCFADIVTLDLNSSPLASVPIEQVPDALVTAGSRANLEATYVGGERLASRGAVADEDQVSADFAATMRSLLKRMQR